jgi:hypothetical protein
MQNRIYILSLAFLILISGQCISQESRHIKDASKLVGVDTNYIVTYPQLLTLSMYTASPVMEVSVTPVNKNISSYGSDFRGNFSNILGFTFSYRNVAINLGFKTPIGPGKDSNKGNSAHTALIVKIQKPWLSMAVDYRRYTGYYDNNVAQYTTPSEQHFYYVRPDVRFKNIGVNGVYNFSWKKYSYNAPLIIFSERQLKTRIGFLIKSGLNYTTISSSDSTILSRTQTSVFTSFDDIKSINAILLKAGPGVGVNLVLFKRFYFALNYFVMGNFIEYTYATQTNGASKWQGNTNFYTESATSFGYNSKRLFIGITANGDINVMRIQNASIKTNFASAGITLGYRFNTPDFFSKAWSKTLTKYFKL